jgi:hypothetical protein
MTCEEAELHMAELLAGEIAPGPRGALEAHLLDCAACRSDFELARAGARVEWPDRPVPPALARATRALFREEPRAVRFFRFGTAAAAALAAALVVANSGRPAPAPAPPAAAPRPALAFVQDAGVGALVVRDEEGRPAGELGLKSHHVSVEILDGIAKTTVEENFQNHTDRRLEGTFHFPLPPDASIFRLALEVNGKLEEGTCLERERAREVFETIVRKMQDPALLEWMPGGIFKCRVFPIEPRATKRVVLGYTQAVPFFRGKATYVYPLSSEKTRAHPPEDVRIDVRVRMSGSLARIESPSHRLDVRRRDAHEAAASFAAANLRPENDFVLTLEAADDELRVVSHKADGEDGYFALFVTPRGEPVRLPDKYVFLLDVSASVSAPELEVAKRLVRAMIERGIPGDRFEVLAHHVDVASSGEVDLRGANAFLERLRPAGACDLLKALRAAPEGEIIYIGEGTPTFGESDPAKILEGVEGRRIRTVAVGSDANVELLARLGGHFRVSPNDDVPRRVAEIAATLGSPAISDLRVEGGEAVADLVGVRDVFYGERLVVAGRFRGPSARLRVTGGGYRRELDVAFPEKEEGNNFVRRLWAQRKVADLLARGGAKDEIVRLGVRHQIMTPYTSFLVLESEQMWKDYRLKREVQAQDRLLGKEKPPAPSDEGLAERVRRLLQEGTDFYKLGKVDEAASRYEEAFQLKPSSDQVYAHIKRVGDDLVAGMMNSPERKMQDAGRRLFELAKPGEPLREGRAAARTNPDELRKQESREEAIREAYEEQLRRERQLSTLSPEASLRRREEEERRGAEERSAGARLTRGFRQATQLGGLEFTLGEASRPPSDLRVDGTPTVTFDAGILDSQLGPGFTTQESIRELNRGYYWQSALPGPGEPTASLDGREYRYGMRDFPGVDILLATNSENSAKAAPLEAAIEDFSLLARDQTLRDSLESEKPQAGLKAEFEAMDTRVLRLRHVQPPAMDAAKPEVGKLITGRPGGAVVKPFGLKQLLEAMLSRDAAGKTVGQLDFDPQTRVFIIRDTAEVQARVQEMAALLDVAPGSQPGEPGFQNAYPSLIRDLVRKARAALALPLETAGRSEKIDEAFLRLKTAFEAAAAAPAEVLTADAAGGRIELATGIPAARGRLLAVTRDGKFVALVQVLEVLDGRLRAAVWRGVAAGRVLPGDRVRRIGDVRAYLAGLPEDVRREIASRAGVEAIRAKMGMKE